MASPPPLGGPIPYAKSCANARYARQRVTLLHGLSIQRTPIDLPDGTRAPRSQSWEELLQQGWTEGGFTPRAAPRSRTDLVNGTTGTTDLFNQLYSQQKMVATGSSTRKSAVCFCPVAQTTPQGSKGNHGLPGGLLFCCREGSQHSSLQDPCARLRYPGYGERRCRIATVHAIGAAAKKQRNTTAATTRRTHLPPRAYSFLVSIFSFSTQRF